MFEHICLKKIKKLCKSAGNCDNKQQHRAILEAAMVSNPEGFTDNSTISPIQYMIVKKYSARKSLKQFSEQLDVKPKTAVRRLCYAKSKIKEPYLEVCCGLVYQRVRYIQKSINRSKNIFKIGFYNILRLCSPQWKMIA